MYGGRKSKVLNARGPPWALNCRQWETTTSKAFCKENSLVAPQNITHGISLPSRNSTTFRASPTLGPEQLKHGICGARTAGIQVKKRPPDPNSLHRQVAGSAPSNTTRMRCAHTDPLHSRNRTKTSHSPEVALFLTRFPSASLPPGKGGREKQDVGGHGEEGLVPGSSTISFPS